MVVLFGQLIKLQLLYKANHINETVMNIYLQIICKRINNPVNECQKVFNN
jgi:hypothetical protein